MLYKLNISFNFIFKKKFFSSIMDKLSNLESVNTKYLASCVKTKHLF